MPEVGPAHPLDYRQEIVRPFFEAVAGTESCAIVGLSSMGKSRLLQFIARSDVQHHYLKEQAPSTLLLLVDNNRLAENSDWGLYELLLTTLTEAAGQQEGTRSLRSEFNTWRREVIIRRDAVLARRYVELAIHMICQEHDLCLCIVLDEFDAAYRNLSVPALANLRALRDAHKYKLCYVMVLREHPARLQRADQCEGFYELFSRSVFGLQPYTTADAQRVIDQLVARKHRDVSASDRAKVLEWSGGHPGLIVALFDLLSSGPQDRGLSWALEQSTIQEECRKLWDGLADDERLALSHVVQHISIGSALRQVLMLKGLLRLAEDGETLFSPILAQFVLMQGAPFSRSLWVDGDARIVWVGQQPIRDLTAREFDLLLFLYHHVGHVCSRDEILAELYPDDNNDDIEDNRVDTLIKRVREKIEPVRNHPRYILTIRRKGYRLVDTPETDG